MNVETPVLRQEDQFRELFGVLRRRKAIILASLVIFALLGVLSTLLVPPSYQVIVRTLIQDYYGGPVAPATDPIAKISQVGVSPELASQIGLMTSPGVLAIAAQQAGTSLEVAQTAVAVQQEEGPLLDVVVNAPDSDLAGRLAAAMPEAYNSYMDGELRTQLRGTLATQEVRLAREKNVLKYLQRVLDVELARQGDTVVASAGEASARTSRLNTYQTEVDNARIALSTAQQDRAATIAAREKLPKLVADTNIHPTVDQATALRNQIAGEEAQLQGLLTMYQDNYPDIVSLKARMRRERQTLATLPKSINTTPTLRNPEWVSYGARITESEIRIKTAQDQLAKYEALVDKEKRAIADYQKRIPIQRQDQEAVDQQQQVVQSVNKIVFDLRNAATSARRPIQTLATSAPVKTQPVVGRTIFTTTLLGLVFGLILALIRDRFDNKIYTLEQIYDVSGAVPIGQVPSSVKALALNAGGQNRNRVLESYRSLRFNLESSSTAGAAQSVLISSASAGEGRAGLSLNLATEAATDQRKTILVDGDMRTPELHDLLKMPRSPGLSDVLSGTTDLDSVLRPTSQDNLLFLPSGSEHGMPLELLVGPSFVALHEALKERADVIVINSPSLMRYTDARAIANVADSVLFVAKRGFTRRDAMRYCIGMLRRAKARLLGVVLSDDATRSKDVPYMAGE